MSVRLLVRVEQLGWHWADFLEIWYLSLSAYLLRKFSCH